MGNGDFVYELGPSSTTTRIEGVASALPLRAEGDCSWSGLLPGDSGGDCGTSGSGRGGEDDIAVEAGKECYRIEDIGNRITKCITSWGNIKKKSDQEITKGMWRVEEVYRQDTTTIEND